MPALTCTLISTVTALLHRSHVHNRAKRIWMNCWKNPSVHAAFALRFQARIFVARGAEKTRARGSIPDQSLLEVLQNPDAGGRLLPSPYNGCWFCWAREYHPNPSFPFVFCCSGNMPFSLVGGSQPQVHVCSENHFILFHAGLEIAMKTGRLQSLRWWKSN